MPLRVPVCAAMGISAIVGLVALVLLTALLQVSFFSRVELFGVSPDGAVLVVMTLGLLGGSVTGAVSGFSIGLLVDCLLMQTLGAFAASLMAVGYVAGRYRESIGRPARKALPLLGRGPVFTLNTDAVWTGPNPLATLRAHWRPDRMDALLLLVARGRATGHAGAGDFLCDGDGRLSRGPGAVYTGAQIIRTEPFAAATDRVFSQNAVWDGIAARGRLFGVLHPGGWCDVGRPASIPLAERLLSEAGRADAV